MTLRLAVVLGLVLLTGIGTVAHRRREARLAAPRDTEVPLHRSLVAGARRTWVVFTTPYCASCGPVLERIAALDPTAALVTVDVSQSPELALRHDVRRAPTVLLADAQGRVLARFVGNVGTGALATAVT
ncbi:MAG: thioredoxin family protein [Acidimicrobiia bacterium]|nr:thioredoxin family protein [Acidimicrobiia bacterium]